MARIYSWNLPNGKYAYISTPIQGQENQAYVGEQLSDENTEIVKRWTSTASTEQYIQNFENLLQKTAYYNVKFENVNTYLNVSQDCDNLRGPKGRSIFKIEPGGEITNNEGTYIIYYVTFDDNSQNYFLMPKPKDGTDGKPGATGAKADQPIASRTVFAYRSGVNADGQILDNIETPSGGEWNYITNEVTYPSGWFANDSNLTPPIWMSTRTFSSTPLSTDSAWSTPQRLTGENGLPGEDGTNMEFIYLLQDTKPNAPSISENVPNYVPNNWNDNPIGVDEDNKIEWYCVRTYDKVNKVWNAWTGPNIWSKYGENGQDGDGVQYIFLINNGTNPNNPTPKDWETNEKYQDKDNEWLPEIGIYINIKGESITQTQDELNGNTPNIWYDNAPSVSVDNQYLWMSQRKYKQGKWSKFTDPSLWAKFGVDGAPGSNATSIRRLYALSDSTSNPPTLPGSSTITGDWGTGYPKDYITNSTASLTSQRHPGKFPKVPGRRRGK